MEIILVTGGILAVITAVKIIFKLATSKVKFDNEASRDDYIKKTIKQEIRTSFSVSDELRRMREARAKNRGSRLFFTFLLLVALIGFFIVLFLESERM